MPFDDQKNSEPSKFYEDQINISTEDYTPPNTMDVFRIGNDLAYFKTQRTFRLKSAPNVHAPSRSPKHLRQRIKSAK